MSSSLDRRECHLALCELTPGLLDGVRDRLRSVRRLEGPLLQVEIGRWQGQKVILVRPRTAAAHEVIEALVTTHPARQTWLVGGATGIGHDVSIGDSILATEVVALDGARHSLPKTEERIKALGDTRTGCLAEGTVSLDADPLPLATTTWATRYVEAMLELGEVHPMLAQVVCLCDIGAESASPPSQRAGARQAGRWVGAWRRPSRLLELFSEQRALWRCQNHLADQLEQLLA